MVDFPIVSERDDGIRPAGLRDECFYCQSKVGEQHKRDCVIVQKRIKARYTFEIEVDVPWFWTEEHFETHRLHSTSCANNVLSEIENFAEANNCACGLLVDAEIVGVIDATPTKPGDQTEKEWEAGEKTRQMFSQPLAPYKFESH